jgi:peptidoglycan hydrolase-like protein with peptidoglycan-binding domain
LSYSIALGRRRIAIAAFAATALLSTPALAAAYQFGSRTLMVGMRGSDVRTLQRDLSVTGFTTRITGVFNRSTKSRVMTFQRRFHLSVDGVVGPQTAGAIRADVARVHSGANAARSADGSSSSSSSTGTSTTTSGTTAPGGSGTGGSSIGAPPSNSPVQPATLGSNGLAVAPADAPQVIREVISAANRIAFKPYVYGGGHASFTSSGYDCSGSVSYALHGGGLLSSPLDSTEFESWRSGGQGNWITIWANGGHAFMRIAGLYFDTAAQSSSNSNDRWSTTRVSPRTGFTVRHPTGW